MANDVAVRELSLLRQYNSKLTGSFLSKVQQEVSKICRKLENQIEKSIEEENRVTHYTQNAINEIDHSTRKLEDIKTRHNLGAHDCELCDIDIANRKKTSMDLERQLEQFKQRHQQLRNELEGSISQLKAFGEIINGHVNAASQSLMSHIEVLEKYKDFHI